VSELVGIARPAGGLALPHTVRLPTRYYDRLAVADVAVAFAEVARVEHRVVDGAIEVVFLSTTDDAAIVVGEFLNQALYASAAGAHP
jgi:hypothetical protein